MRVRPTTPASAQHSSIPRRHRAEEPSTWHGCRTTVCITCCHHMRFRLTTAILARRSSSPRQHRVERSSTLQSTSDVHLPTLGCRRRGRRCTRNHEKTTRKTQEHTSVVEAWHTLHNIPRLNIYGNTPAVYGPDRQATSTHGFNAL